MSNRLHVGRTEPYLWAAIDDDGLLIGWGHSRESARVGMGEAECIPLYRSLALTDEERDAIEWAISAAEDCQHPADDTLRGLLERTK